MLSLSVIYFRSCANPLRDSDVSKPHVISQSVTCLVLILSRLFCARCAFAISAQPRAHACETCAEGRYQPLPCETSCARCPAGKHRNSTHSLNDAGGAATACVDCDRGRYSGADGAVRCAGCFIGKAQRKKGQTECLSCETGQYQNLAAQLSCLYCKKGTYQAVAFLLEQTKA